MLNHSDSEWRVGDGAYPVRLPDQRVAWIFSDTVVGNVDAGGRLVTGQWAMTHGSMLIQQGRCVEPYFGDTVEKGSLIPDRSRSHFFWPGAGWVDRDHATLLVAAAEIELDRDAPGGYRDLGSVIARFDLPDLRYLGMERMPATPLPDAPAWAPWPTAVGSHVYFRATDHRDHVTARISIARSGSPRTADWEYWTGSGWSAEPARVKPMAFDDGAPIEGLSVVPWKDGYLAAAKRGSILGQDVGAWTGPSPAGPWTSIGVVADLRDLASTRTYNGHIAIETGSAQPLVVWSIGPSVKGQPIGAGIGVKALDPEQLEPRAGD